MAHSGYCPDCDERTTHNIVRYADSVGRFAKCRQCSDVVEGLDSGKYEHAYKYA